VNLNASLSKTFSFNLPAPASSGQQSTAGGRSLIPTDEGAGNRTGVNGTAEARPMYLTFSVDVENMLNHTNLAGYNGVLTSSFFGRANRALEARRILLGVRLSF
jgi:hypothetical protein